MQANAIKIEANISTKKAKLKSERKVTIKEEPYTSTSDHKIDNLVIVVEKTMQIININDQSKMGENQTTPQNRKQNFRRNIPQIKQQEQKGPYQQVRPPFQENYIDDEGNIIEYLDDRKINMMGINDDEFVFITQEEQELFLLTQTELDSKE